MTLAEEIKRFAESIPIGMEEKRGIYELFLIVAERKAFFTRQKLEYRAKFRIDDTNRVVKFTEMLKEAGGRPFHRTINARLRIRGRNLQGPWYDEEWND